MGFELVLLEKTNIGEFLKKQIDTAINEFDECTIFESVKDMKAEFRIIIVQDYALFKKEYHDLSNTYLVVLIDAVEDFIRSPKLLYATFSNEVRKEMYSKGLKDIFVLPFSLNQEVERFEDGVKNLDNGVSTYVKKSISYYWDKNFEYYKRQFNLNALYRQILKVKNYSLNAINIANANLNYKYASGERPE